MVVKMNYKSFLGMVLISSLAACGSAPTPEEKAARAKNASVWSTRKAVEYNGNTYNVATNPDRTFAFVAAACDFPRSAKDLEAVASKASGCRADFQAGILEFLGGYSDTTDLRPIEEKISKFKYWRADLAC